MFAYLTSRLIFFLSLNHAIPYLGEQQQRMKEFTMYMYSKFNSSVPILPKSATPFFSCIKQAQKLIELLDRLNPNSLGVDKDPETIRIFSTSQLSCFCSACMHLSELTRSLPLNHSCCYNMLYLNILAVAS